MKTVQFPPLCPFGDSVTDAIVLGRPSSRWVCWPVSAEHFLRVNVYEDGDVTYLIAGRKEIQDEFLGSADDIEEPDDRAGTTSRLREWKLNRIAKLINKPQSYAVIQTSSR